MGRLKSEKYRGFTIDFIQQFTPRGESEVLAMIRGGKTIVESTKKEAFMVAKNIIDREK